MGDGGRPRGMHRKVDGRVSRSHDDPVKTVSDG